MTFIDIRRWSDLGYVRNLTFQQEVNRYLYGVETRKVIKLCKFAYTHVYLCMVTRICIYVCLCSIDVYKYVYNGIYSTIITNNIMGVYGKIHNFLTFDTFNRSGDIVNFYSKSYVPLKGTEGATGVMKYERKICRVD